MNDAISRSEALEGVNQHSYETAHDWEATMDILKELPALDVAPVVHARWRYKAVYSNDVRIANIVYCTSCVMGYRKAEDTVLNYCPYCGARMDGEADAD